MGRKVPLANNDPSQAFHQTLSIPLFLAAMAAVMALVSILCGVRSRRKSESATDKPPEKNTNTNTNSNSPLSSTPGAAETPNSGEEREAVSTVIDIIESSSSSSLQPEIESQKNQITSKKTPGKQIIKDTFSSTSLLAKSASTRNLAKNLSMKMTRSMSMAGRDLQDRMKKGGKLKPEESVWMKTIILGEKCKVNDGEEAIIYERKGNKIAAYHPKTSNGGLIDQNGTIRSQDPQNGEPKDFSE